MARRVEVFYVQYLYYHLNIRLLNIVLQVKTEPLLNVITCLVQTSVWFREVFGSETCLVQTVFGSNRCLVQTAVWSRQVCGSDTCLVQTSVWFRHVFGSERCLVQTAVWFRQFLVYWVQTHLTERTSKSIWFRQVFGLF